MSSLQGIPAQRVSLPKNDICTLSAVLRFTCDECVEGMEFVEAYMRDPLWVAEYTLYLEQNFCVHDQVS